jgi:alpha-ribazole phosphatase
MVLDLVRHTSVSSEYAKICYGSGEVPLALSFFEERLEVKKRLGVQNYTQVISSPATRCSKLAEFLFPEKVTIQPAIQEMNFGDWTFLAWEEIPKDQIQPWYEDFVNYTIPGGESFFEFYQRVIHFYKSNVQENSTMLWVTHAGVIRALVAYSLQLDLQKAFRFSIDLGSLTRFKLSTDYLHLETLNYL